MSAGGDEELDALFHALADSTRRLILAELAKRDDQALFEICVRIAEEYGISLSRQAISKHLAILEGSGLITSRREGRTKLHTSRLSAHVPKIEQWLQNCSEQGVSRANRRNERLR